MPSPSREGDGIRPSGVARVSRVVRAHPGAEGDLSSEYVEPRAATVQ